MSVFLCRGAGGAEEEAERRGGGGGHGDVEEEEGEGETHEEQRDSIQGEVSEGRGREGGWGRHIVWCVSSFPRFQVFHGWQYEERFKRGVVLKH